MKDILDPKFAVDIMLREQEHANTHPTYTVEVFSDGTRDPEDVKNDIYRETGMMPSVYD